MKQIYFYKLFIMGVLLFGNSLFAQTVTGVVTDNNGTLPGVNVLVKGTSNGTSTDFDGKYTIDNIAADAVLVVSYLGYVTQEIPVNGMSVIDIVLTEDVQALDEVVFVGYSSRKKSTITGAVSTVDLSDMEKTRVTNVAQAMQGQIAGVQVTSSSGAPGDPIEIRIRGVGTIGNNNPLYIVDGVPTTDISFLNQADIAKMSILKDAASAAIYGSRAAAGVVLIKTKSGTIGKTSFDSSYYIGVSNITDLPNMLNADQYINTLEKAWNNTFTGANPYTAAQGSSNFADTDWLDELFEQGITQNLQFTASGGSEETQFLLSLGYYEQDGAVVYSNDKFKKVNFRTNINSQLNDRFKVGTNLQLSFTQQDAIASTGESLIRFALLRAPILAVKKDVNDPFYSESDPFTDLPFYTGPGYNIANVKSLYEIVGNPIAQAFFTDDVREVFKTFGNVYGEYAFLKDKELIFRTNVGVNFDLFHNKRFNQNYGDDDFGADGTTEEGQGRQNRPNSLSEVRGERLEITLTNLLNYNKTFNEKHDFTALLGQEYIVTTGSDISASRSRFPFDFVEDELKLIDIGSLQDLRNGGFASKSTLLSYFTSASYVYDNKYMFTANFRADGSSRFGPNNKWGYFPSFSAGWKISDETFLSDVDWLSNLKIRGSWGQVGNQNIGDNTFRALFALVDGEVKEVRKANPDLKWETSTQTNIGLDIGLFNNKLAITTEYFIKNTDDILLPVAFPFATTGDIQPSILNAGEVENKGFEFSLNYRNSDHEIKYNISGNFATLTNNVEKLHPNVPDIFENGGRTRTAVGQPLGAYYGFRMEGIYQDQAEIDGHLSGSSAEPGDIRFKDVNNDGIINSDDREFIGSPIPDLTYGLAFSADYKRWDFSILFQGVDGIERYNDGKQIVDYDTRPFNYTTGILNAWDGPGTSNTRPRVAFEDTGVSKISSIFVEDASYLRLKNIEVGYTLDSIKGIENLRFYISGQNVFTSTDYTGLDPEVSSLVDNGTFPSSTSFLFGVNVKL